MSTENLDTYEKEILAAASVIYSGLVMEVWKNSNHEELAQRFSVKSAIGLVKHIKKEAK